MVYLNRYQELANRVDEALGFMAAARLTVDHPIMTTTEFWTSHECFLLPYEEALTRLDSFSKPESQLLFIRYSGQFQNLIFPKSLN